VLYFLIVALFLLLMIFVILFYLDRVSCGWPTTQASIVDYGIIGPTGGGLHRPYVRYKYTVAENSYVCERLSILDISIGDKQKVMDQLSKFSGLTEVTVYYWPLWNGLSVIAPSSCTKKILFLIFITLIGLIGSVVII